MELAKQPTKIDTPLKGRNALVTGSAKGLGRAIALRLAELGAGVGIHYRSSEREANDLAETVRSLGVSSTALPADLSNLESAKNLACRMEESLGPISILIPNVGEYSTTSLPEEDPSDFLRILTTNLGGTFALTSALLPTMRARRQGQIVMIGQVGAEHVRAHPTETAYQISKTGLLMLMRSLAAAEGKNGITCNMVSPGILHNTTYLPPNYMGRIPLGRLGEFTDVLGAIEYLLSPAAVYVTGTNVEVAGGYGL